MPVHALTRTMPIVVIGGPDLIEEGLADSLARPGGNVTGIAILRGELDGKRLELLRELVPAATQVTRRHIDDWAYPIGFIEIIFTQRATGGPLPSVKGKGWNEQKGETEPCHVSC